MEERLVGDKSPTGTDQRVAGTAR